MTTVLVKGTKENLIVDVTDQIGSLTTLDGANGTFDVRLKNDGTNWVVSGQAIINIGMRAYCLVDTDSWEIGVYELFINFENLPEEPRLGPVEFEVAHG